MRNSLPYKITLFSLLSLLAAIPGLSGATPLIDEDFTNGSSTAPLNGTTADAFSADLIAAGGSSTWVAMDEWRAQGNIVTTGVGNYGTAYLSVGSYINDSMGTAQGKFSLEGHMINSSSASLASWLAMSFYNNPITGLAFFNQTTYGTALIRNEDNADSNDYYAGVGSDTTNDRSGDAGDVFGSMTYEVVMDFTPGGGYDPDSNNYGTVSFYKEGSSIPDFTYTYNAAVSINAIGISKTDEATYGNFTYLTLTQIPEPSTYAITAAFGALCLGLAIRRRRK